MHLVPHNHSFNHPVNPPLLVQGRLLIPLDECHQKRNAIITTDRTQQLRADKLSHLLDSLDC